MLVENVVFMIEENFVLISISYYPTPGFLEFKFSIYYYNESVRSPIEIPLICWAIKYFVLFVSGSQMN